MVRVRSVNRSRSVIATGIPRSHERSFISVRVRGANRLLQHRRCPTELGGTDKPYSSAGGTRRRQQDTSPTRPRQASARKNRLLGLRGAAVSAAPRVLSL